MATYAVTYRVNIKSHCEKVGVERETYSFCTFDKIIDLFCVVRFVVPYTSSDYPVELKLRQYLSFQASVKSKDKTLSVLAENCYATPTQDRKDATKYYLITDG